MIMQGMCWKQRVHCLSLVVPIQLLTRTSLEVHVLAVTIVTKNLVVFGPIFSGPLCASQTLVPYLVGRIVSFYFTCEVELSVAPVPSFLRATRVRLSMLIGWHCNRVIWWVPFSREWRCERVGPMCGYSFLRLIWAVTVGNLTMTCILDHLESLNAFKVNGCSDAHSFWYFGRYAV